MKNTITQLLLFAAFCVPTLLYSQSGNGEPCDVYESWFWCTSTIMGLDNCNSVHYISTAEIAACSFAGGFGGGLANEDLGDAISDANDRYQDCIAALWDDVHRLREICRERQNGRIGDCIRRCPGGPV